MHFRNHPPSQCCVLQQVASYSMGMFEDLNQAANVKTTLNVKKESIDHICVNLQKCTFIENLFREDVQTSEFELEIWSWNRCGKIDCYECLEHFGLYCTPEWLLIAEPLGKTPNEYIF